MLFYSQCENGLIGFEFEDRSILSLEYYQYFCGGPQLGAPGYLQQRQRASDEKSTHSLHKDAQFHRPTASVHTRYTYTTTLMSPVCVPGTKRPIFPLHFSLCHYKLQNVVNHVQLLTLLTGEIPPYISKTKH